VGRVSGLTGWRLPDPATPSDLVEFADSLNGLPARQRMAIVLRFLEELDDDEIAVLIGCRRATVRSLVHRGLAGLREVLVDE
jgi:RNA polymerase sigma factor (sigma-70 family)